MKVKLLTLIGLAVMLTGLNSHAADPCDKAAIKAAKKWAKSQSWANYQPILDQNFRVVSYRQNNKGESVALVQLYRDGSMCWTNIDVIVQESADNSCKAAHVEANAYPDGCV